MGCLITNISHRTLESWHVLQVWAIEFVILAIEFVPLALEFIALAQEFIIIKLSASKKTTTHYKVNYFHHGELRLSH